MVSNIRFDIWWLIGYALRVREASLAAAEFIQPFCAFSPKYLRVIQPFAVSSRPISVKDQMPLL